MIPDNKIDRFEWLEKRVSQLEKENLELKKLVLALHKQNAGLRWRLLAYENAHTPPSKSKKKRLPKDEPSGKLGAPVGHEKYERQQPEPTNNAAERALYELIVLRKIIGGLRRETGARTLETITTMFATWKQQEKPLYPTLKAAVNG